MSTSNLIYRLFTLFIIFPVKCQKKGKMPIRQPKVISSDILCFSTMSPKPREIQFGTIYALKAYSICNSHI